MFCIKPKNSDSDDSMARLISHLEFPLSAKKIGIKLNLCDYRLRETGVTSDPTVIESLLKVLRKKYPEVDLFLIENDATPTSADNLFPYLGIDKVAEKYACKCINLAHEKKWIEKEINGYNFKKIEFPKLIENLDILINHPKLKTHGRTKISCSLKNMFGCYRVKEKIQYHPFLDKAIVDINLAIKCHYTLVDANLCLEGNRGPSQGFPKKVGLFIGGRDIVAVDSFCAKLMGFHPYLVKHIRMAAKKKIGSMKYNLNGDLLKKDLKKYRFDWSIGNYMFMQFIRILGKKLT